MRARPTLRSNNGSIVIRVRIDGEDKRIYRLGRWDDPVAVARAEAITAEIWSDIQRGELDESLSRYRPQVQEEAELGDTPASGLSSVWMVDQRGQ